MSFSKDGNVVVADYTVPSAGLGVWTRAGHDRFAVTYLLLLSDGQGTLQARIKVRTTLRPDPVSDTWDGAFRVDITDPTGQFVVASFEGTAHGTRMHVEALP